MQILPTSVLFPNFDRIEQLSTFFTAVKHDFLALYEKEYFKPTKKPAIYIYRIDTPKRFYQGITVVVPIESYTDGTIKAHEGTLETKEKLQLALLKDRNAQIKPVLLTYHTVPEIEDWMLKQQQQTPFLTFQQGKSQHTIWEVHQADEIVAIQQLFQQCVKHTYIADGHHRTTITARYAAELKQSLPLCCTLFSADQVEISPFHRVVEGLPERTLRDLMQHLSQWCTIEKSDGKHLPSKHSLKMYVQQQWFDLTWKPAMLHQQATQKILDAALLDLELLQHLMKVENIRTNNRIQYIAGDDTNFEALEKLVNEDKNRVGFCLAPLPVEDFMHFVNEERIMPPKSTWFKPRILNGLFVHLLKA